jgi:hypothetical protein
VTFEEERFAYTSGHDRLAKCRQRIVLGGHSLRLINEARAGSNELRGARVDTSRIRCTAGLDRYGGIQR